MARCGCGTTCGCFVVGGANVTVTGSGTEINPFTVSAAAQEISVEVQDSPCIALTGDGSGGSPLTAAPVISGTAGNQITCSSDGLFVPAAAAATVTVADTPCINMSGDGSVGTPISAVPTISPTAGNQLSCAGNGLFVPEPTIDIADTSCINLSGAGSAASPLSAAPIINPVAGNRISCAGAGLTVLPGGVVTGCGLDGDGSTGTPLVVDTQVWPYPCDVTANAGGVYCDANGALRSEPRGQIALLGDFGNRVVSPAVAVPAGSQVVVETHSITIVNPDPCRPAVALVTAYIDVDFTLPANSSATAGWNNDDQVHWENRGSTTAAGVHIQSTKVFERNIPAGGTLLETLNITMGGGTGGATYTRVQYNLVSHLFVV